MSQKPCCISGEQKASDVIHQFVVKYFLLIGLTIVLPLGLMFPRLGIHVSSLHFGGTNAANIAHTIIFFVSGMSLRRLKGCVDPRVDPRVLAIALLLVLELTPALAVPGLTLMEASFLPAHLTHGIAIFCTVPTTLSLAEAAHGNTDLATVITMTANIIGTWSMPTSVNFMFRSITGVEVLPIFVFLCITILMPLLGGIIFQKSIRGVHGFVKAEKTKLSLLTNSCVLFSVWMTVSSAHSEILKMPITVLLKLTLVGVALHAGNLAIAFVTSSLMGFSARERRTLVLVCSQKSLPVSFCLIAALPTHLQQFAGLMTVPCIVGYATQLLMQTAILDRWSENQVEDAKLPLVMWRTPFGEPQEP